MYWEQQTASLWPRRLRRWFFQTHLALVWLSMPLLTFHVIAVYAY